MKRKGKGEEKGGESMGRGKRREGRKEKEGKGIASWLLGVWDGLDASDNAHGITNRKLHTGFRLVPTSMTLNDIERRNSLYFAFFAEFDRFSGRLYHSG